MLNNEEMILIKAGGIGATALNAISRLITTLLEVGRAVGSSIRRAREKKICKIN